MFGNPLFLTPKPSKTGFLNPKTGNSEHFQTIFVKFLRVQKDWIFPKKFQTSKTELFRNLQKRKVWKIPSFAGPYFKTSFDDRKNCVTYEFGWFYSFFCPQFFIGEEEKRKKSSF